MSSLYAEVLQNPWGEHGDLWVLSCCVNLFLRARSRNAPSWDLHPRQLLTRYVKSLISASGGFAEPRPAGTWQTLSLAPAKTRGSNTLAPSDASGAVQSSTQQGRQILVPVFLRGIIAFSTRWRDIQGSGGSSYGVRNPACIQGHQQHLGFGRRRGAAARLPAHPKETQARLHSTVQRKINNGDLELKQRNEKLKLFDSEE